MTHQFSFAHKQLIQIAIVAILVIGCVAVLLPFTGLLARSGMPGYSLWLLLHLVAGHVFLWCAPHCRFARLLR